MGIIYTENLEILYSEDNLPIYDESSSEYTATGLATVSSTIAAGVGLTFDYGNIGSAIITIGQSTCGGIASHTYKYTANPNLSVDHIYNDNKSNILLSNLKMYYDWGLLSIGGWSEVNINDELSNLSVVDDPSYIYGQVWKAPKKDFVWENVEYTDVSGTVHIPLAVGIPNINGSYTSLNYDIDYSNGLVIFEDPININSNIKLSYSYKNIQIYILDELNNNSIFSNIISSGNSLMFNQNTIQLPSILICTKKSNPNGIMLGTSQQRFNTKVEFYILSDSDYMRNNLLDIVSLQTNSSIRLFDTNVASSAMNMNNTYNELISPTGYYYGLCHLQDSNIVSINHISSTISSAVVCTNMSIIK